MKKIRRKMAGLVVAAAMVCCVNLDIVHAGELMEHAGSDMVSIMYVQNNKCNISLKFRGTKATCFYSVTGRNNTSSISGTLKLYDNTSKRNVASWAVSKKGSSCRGEKTATVKKGHSYTLSFSGKVYGKNSKYGESISSSTSKTN